MFRKCTLSPRRMGDAQGFILSFWPEWQQKLSENEISIVFRKNAALIPTPAYLYAYLNRPVQKIIGRARLEKITKHTVTECLAMAPQSGYSSEDIRVYAGLRPLYVFSLGAFEVAPKPISLTELKASYNFVPSPQAIILSGEGRRELDACLGFGER